MIYFSKDTIGGKDRYLRSSLLRSLLSSCVLWLARSRLVAPPRKRVQGRLAPPRVDCSMSDLRSPELLWLGTMGHASLPRSRRRTACDALWCERWTTSGRCSPPRSGTTESVCVSSHHVCDERTRVRTARMVSAGADDRVRP